MTETEGDWGGVLRGTLPDYLRVCRFSGLVPKMILKKYPRMWLQRNCRKKKMVGKVLTRHGMATGSGMVGV